MRIEYNIRNEILKKRYEQVLELDGKLSDRTVYSKLKDIRRFEEFTKFRDVTSFSKDHALGFKERLRNRISDSKPDLAYATAARMLKNVRAFYEWMGKNPV